MTYCIYNTNQIYFIQSLSIKFSLSKSMHLHFFKIFNIEINIENYNKNDINAISNM